KLFVKLKSIGNGVQIDATEYVRTEENIGTDCKITSDRWVSGQKIGARTIITVKGDVTADVIGEYTRIIAAGRIETRRVEEYAYVRADYDVQIKEFAAESADIESGNNGVVTVAWQFRKNKPLPAGSAPLITTI